MSRKRRSVRSLSKSLPDVAIDTAAQPVELCRQERVLIVGTDSEALETMCTLLRQGATQAIIVRDRWPVAPHSITLIVVPARAPAEQVAQAIDMAPRALTASGRLVVRLAAERTSEWNSRIERALRRSGFDLEREETPLGRLLCTVPAASALHAIA